jgi:hypothetical protein
MTTKTLDDAIQLQEQTIEALKNINDELLDAEDTGTVTLESLRRDNYKLHNIILEETDRLNDAHKTTRRLHNRLGVWTLNFGGGGRPATRVSTKKSSAMRKRDPSKQIDTPVTLRSGSKANKNQNRNENAANANEEAGILFGMSGLKDTHADELKELDDNDKEIDTMLDEASKILTSLGTLNNNVASEIQTSTEGLEMVENQIEKADYNQEVNNARALSFLHGRWLRRQNDTTRSTK